MPRIDILLRADDKLYDYVRILLVRAELYPSEIDPKEITESPYFFRLDGKYVQYQNHYLAHTKKVEEFIDSITDLPKERYSMLIHCEGTVEDWGDGDFGLCYKVDLLTEY